ncbi:MAG: DUF2335 domain-containing protein [Lachnospiraceae bacterium]|nr:DUF2335 domain-containing protein [Lachnospiraceae bacterium]
MSETQLQENVENAQNQKNDVIELKNEEVKQVVHQAIEEYAFSGPIPPPNILSGYEELLPGAADRILSMAERQTQHRHSMEKKIIETEARDSLLGIIFGFALGIGCVVAAIIMVFAYPEAAGVVSAAVLGGSGVASIAITSINRNKANSASNQEEKE